MRTSSHHEHARSPSGIPTSTRNGRLRIPSHNENIGSPSLPLTPPPPSHALLVLFFPKMAGFYRSGYTTVDGESRVMASTQFEALDARRCFPCWDEPARKAVFQVGLTFSYVSIYHMLFGRFLLFCLVLCSFAGMYMVVDACLSRVEASLFAVLFRILFALRTVVHHCPQFEHARGLKARDRKQQRRNEAAA